MAFSKMIQFSSQNEQLGVMTDSVGNLRNISRQIGSELDEQAVMLDEFGAEIENAETKLDATMRKMAKVLHMSNGEQEHSGEESPKQSL